MGIRGSLAMQLLRGVVPIASTAIAGNVALTLVSIEEYETVFCVNSFVTPSRGHPISSIGESLGKAAQQRLSQRLAVPDSGAVAPMQHRTDDSSDVEPSPSWYWPDQHMTLRDDEGHSYFATRGFGGGEYRDGAYRVRFFFGPVIAAGASRLRIDVEKISWTRLRPSREDMFSTSDLGPWRFDVDLGERLIARTIGNER